MKNLFSVLFVLLFLSCSLFEDNSFTIITESLDSVRCGQDYYAVLESSFSTDRILEYSISEGTLPAGLRLNKYTGSISGRPCGSPQTSFFSVKIRDLIHETEAEKELSILVEEWEWLLVFYMGGENSLSAQVAADIAEMQAGIGSLSGVKIVALTDSRSGSLLYEGTGSVSGGIIEKPLSFMGLIDHQEVNMADGTVLTKLLSYASTAFPSDHFGLIFWDHGDGWRSLSSGENRSICTDESNPGDALYTGEIEAALTDPSLYSLEMDIIGFDLCYGGMFEVAYELRNTANYMVASEAKENEAGWDYQALFSDFAGTDRSPEAFCISMIDSFEKTYSTSAEDYTLSALDLSEMVTLMTSFNGLLTNISGFCTSDTVEDLRSVFINSEGFGDLPGDYNIDLKDAFSHFISTDYPESLRASASTFLSALDTVVVSEWSKTENTHGLSVHLIPLEEKLSSSYTIGVYDSAYRKGFVGDYPLDFVEESSWSPDFLLETGFLYELFIKEY